MKTKDLTFIALGAAIIAAVSSLPQIQLVGAVPITLQMLAIMTVSAILGGKRGGLAVLIFLLLAAAGLPVLGGKGGLAPFVGPTVGYLIAFPIAGFFIGLVAEKTRRFVPLFIGMIVFGLGLVYLLGTFGLMAVLDLSFKDAFAINYPFVLWDTIKAVIATTIAVRLLPLRLFRTA
ncbi:biotin transporter BioY [Exiguobacterium acetylicum]|uniref:biotin transporter BioY n=1 Tax=Exiguobacterium acetylicum TaxID=41170 RepID=UPI000682C684|nr:biotin transporter BioY [Exiguobacterium acetylicum]KNH32772.1 acetyl-COA carboxylase [Exiguobacterium acetylicum]